jgi:hypothetical protein
MCLRSASKLIIEKKKNVPQHFLMPTLRHGIQLMANASRTTKENFESEHSATERP